MALLTLNLCTPRRSTFPASRYQAPGFSIRRRKHASPPIVIYMGLKIISATQRIAFQSSLSTAPTRATRVSPLPHFRLPPDRGSTASPARSGGSHKAPNNFSHPLRNNRELV